jgi:type IV pilus assembly protein PilW
VAENVEDLDFLYGVDTDSDGTVDSYMSADTVAANQWRQVLSVRVSLVAVSAEAAKNLGGKPQVIYLRDSTGDGIADAQDAGNKPNDPKDRLRLRQVFTTTVALRNRLP